MQRREGLKALVPAGWWPALALVGAGALAWLAGSAAGVGLARHLGLVVMLQGSAIAVLGPNVARGLFFPLAYMIFLVPFGEGLEGPLQAFTVEMVMGLLHLAGVPASVDGVLITIPNGYLEVAEACSGAKFVIAMIAYGTLVANVCFVRWSRRAAFMALALVVPVLANGVRAFATIYAAWWTSVEAATGFDHILYGWVFFAAVMAGVLAIGWRWFDRDPDADWFDPAALQGQMRGQGDALLAGLVALTIAAGAASWGAAVAARADPVPARVTLPELAGWRHVPMQAAGRWTPSYPGADHLVIGRYVDAMGVPVDLAVAIYGGQQEGRELVGFGIGAISENDVWVRVEDLPELASGRGVRITAPGPIERDVFTWNRIGEALTASDRHVKLETLRVKLLGGRQRAVAVLVSVPRGRGDSRAAATRFLRALGPIDAFADRMAGVRD